MGGNYSSQHTLAREGKTEELKKLQKSKTLKINAKDHLGWTCLHWAAHFNRVETVHWLLQNGADINSRNANVRHFVETLTISLLLLYYDILIKTMQTL
jgi:ankyrin repeat protein